MLDSVIKMNLVFLEVVCLLAFIILISMAVIYCIDFLQQYMNTHIVIVVVSVVTIELIFFGLSFAKYLIGGQKMRLIDADALIEDIDKEIVEAKKWVKK